MITLKQRIICAAISFFLGYVTAWLLISESATAVKTAVVAESATAELGHVAERITESTELASATDKQQEKVITVFKYLEREAKNDAPNSVDSCVLPDERLQRWRAANAGTSDSSSALQLDSRSETTTTARQWSDQNTGTESSGSGVDVSPVSATSVWTDHLEQSEKSILSGDDIKK